MKPDLNSEFSVQALKTLWAEKGARFDGQESEGWEEEKGERVEVRPAEKGLQIMGGEATCMKTSSR